MTSTVFRIMAAGALALFSLPALGQNVVQLNSNDIRNIKTSPTLNETYRGRKVNRTTSLMDNVSYSSWVAKSNPKGTWLTFDFVGKRYITQFALIPGCAGSGRTFADFSRPATVELIGDNKTIQLNVADKRKTQTFSLANPLVAESVTIRVKRTHRGNSADTCISEVRFFEQNVFGGINETTRSKIESHADALSSAAPRRHVRALIRHGAAAVPRVSLTLQSKNEEVQKLALHILNRIGSPLAASALLSYYESNPPAALAKQCLKALAATGDRRATSMLVNALSSEDEELVEFADEALSRFGTNIVTPVRSLLTHEHEEVVERALEALRHVRNASVVPLARPFAAHRYSPYRRAAATALTGTDSQPGLALLERLATDPIVSVRLSAARALEGYQRAEIRNLLSQLVRDRDEEVAIQALDLLSRDPGGASYIVDYLNQPVVTFGEQAILALARTQSNQALNVLIEWLRRGESRFRSALRQGIVTFGRRGVEALLEAAIVDSRLRLDAQKILNAHPTIAAPLIVKVIKRNPAGAPSFVIEALGQNAGSSSLKVLDQAYQSGGIQVKMSVVKAWGNYRGELVAKRLMAVLQSGNPALKTTAVKAIGNAQVKEAAMPLVKLLTEKDFPAHLAISALGKLRSAAASPHLVIRFSTAPLSERFAILHACSAMQTPSCIKLLYGATDDDDKDVRKEALKLIASR